MNKGRSRGLSERMKGVFRSRSRVPHSKIPESPKSGTSDQGEIIPDWNKNIKDFCFSRNSNLGKSGLNKKNPGLYSPLGSEGNSRQTQLVASSSCFGNKNSFRNEKVEATSVEKSYNNINDHSSGPLNGPKDGLPSHNELHLRNNVLNVSCQSCPPSLDINQNSSHGVNNGITLSQQITNYEGTNNNNNNNNYNHYTSLRMPKSYRCGTGICHFCLKQICICGNENIISNKDNYFNSPEGSFRFSQVLRNAFGEEKNNRNEFIILALGVQHYIKEVFNALDYNNNGYVNHEDLQILCKILGKDLEYWSNSDLSCSSCEDNEDQICVNNNCKTHLHLEKFSEVLCHKFSKLSDRNLLEKRKNTQLVNAVVNISRRSESLSVLTKQLDDLEKDYLELQNKSKYCTLPINNSVNSCKSCTKYRLMENKNKENNIYLENMKLQKIILLQQQELQCLREVIEDLRISLQCSDAENISLRVREVKSQGNSSEDRISKAFTLSTEDDKDSIDRIIQNFPSSEDLNMSSNESLLTIRSLQSRSTSKSPRSKLNQTDIDERSKLLTKKISERLGDDDLGLNKEIQLVYQELSDTRSELEDTRADLENTVSEIQTNNENINRLTKNLNEMKVHFDKSVAENSNLKEKIILLKNIEKNKDTQVNILEKQVTELKSHLANADEQTKILCNELQAFRVKRKHDLDQLSRTRNLIAKTLVEINKKESLLKSHSNQKESLLKSHSNQKESLLKSHSTNDNGKGENFHSNSSVVSELNSKVSDNTIVTNAASYNVNTRNNTNNNNNINNTKTVTFNTVNNSSYNCNKTESIYNSNTYKNFTNENSNNFYNNVNSCHIRNSDNYRKLSSNSEDNYHEKDQRLNLSPCESRRTEFNFQNSSFRLPKETQKDDDIRRGFNQEVRGTSPAPVVSPKDKPRSLGTILSEEKPTLEVKPNLIRPIGIMKPILKNFLAPPNTPRFSSTDNLKPCKSRPHSQGPFLSPDLNNKILVNEGNSNQNVNKNKEISDCKAAPAAPVAPKTSTQILEGLEAEVEYLLNMF